MLNQYCNGARYNVFRNCKNEQLKLDGEILKIVMTLEKISRRKKFREEINCVNITCTWVTNKIKNMARSYIAES